MYCINYSWLGLEMFIVYKEKWLILVVKCTQRIIMDLNYVAF